MPVRWRLASALTAVGGVLPLLLSASGCASAAALRPAAPAPTRTEQWVNTLRSEPITIDELLDELESTRVIYLGEYHTIPRHQELQLSILHGLARRGIPLVLGMEPFEGFVQPALDRFNAGEIDLATLLIDSDWDQRWENHATYHALLTAARTHQIPVLALNARAETIRAVGRQGLNGITAEQRAELPTEIVSDDPLYERLMTRILSVHMAFDPEKLRPVFEAQVARDETMSARLASYLASSEGTNRTALVICGRGHCEFGLGMPDRVERRMPGISQRVILFSQSGDLQLSEIERRQAREIEVPHQFLRDLGRSPADFMHITELRSPNVHDFDQLALGTPTGWTIAVTGPGTANWRVAIDPTAPSPPHVLRQDASVDRPSFPVCLLDGSAVEDGFVEVQFKALSGAIDQAAGLVWRAQDRANYYVCRANALENNVVMYKVEAGQRHALDIMGRTGGYGVETPVTQANWHTLRVDFAGPLFKASLDGVTLFTVEDRTFTEAGQVGLWTKADSVTVFDDFNFRAE
jgi:uncharacterized iron-regulated protein